MGSVLLPSAISRFNRGAAVIRGSGVAATKVKEWTLATKSKQEKNMVVVGSRRSVGTSTSFIFKQVYLFVPAHTQMFFFYMAREICLFLSHMP